MVKSRSRSSSSSRDDGKKSTMKEEVEEEEKVQYKGVRMRRWGSWVSEIRAPKQKTRIWLGSYSTQEAAARAYDAALLCLKGSSASFNFPFDSLDVHVPPAAHLSTKSIQRLAAAAAAAPNIANTTTTTTPLSPSPSVASPAISTVDTSSSNCTAAVLQEECDDSWFDSAFQPHKSCMMMLGGGCGGAFFDPQPLPLPQVEEYCFDEVGDIRLWSF